MRNKLLAGVGGAWIVAAVAFLMTRNTPIEWKIAWIEYGLIGMVHLVAFALDKEERHRRTLRRLQLGGALIALALFAAGTLRGTSV